jgi:hypothetical protein
VPLGHAHRRVPRLQLRAAHDGPGIRGLGHGPARRWREQQAHLGRPGQPRHCWPKARRSWAARRFRTSRSSESATHSARASPPPGTTYTASRHASRTIAGCIVPTCPRPSSPSTMRRPFNGPARHTSTTLYVLPNSAHCHNFATTRAELWDRIGLWAANRPEAARPCAQARSRGRSRPRRPALSSQDDP